MKKTQFEIFRFKKNDTLYIIEWPNLFLIAAMGVGGLMCIITAGVVFWAMLDALRGLINGTRW